MARGCKHLFLIAAGIIFLLSKGCIRPVPEKDVPELNPKLVVGAFISPQDTLVKISLTKTQVIGSVIDYDNYQFYVRNAHVEISDGTNSAVLPYDYELEVYTIDANTFPIQGGTTYFLNIETPDGLSARSRCKVPEKVNSSLQVLLDTIIHNADENMGFFNGAMHVVSASWNDNLGFKSYYRLTIKLRAFNNSGNSSTSEVYFSNRYGIYSGNGNFMGPFKGTANSFSATSNFYTSKLLNCNFYTIDEHYYEYYKSMSKHQGDYFSEPFNYYTNIEGGLGVFAAYQIYETTVVLED